MHGIKWNKESKLFQPANAARAYLQACERPTIVHVWHGTERRRASLIYGEQREI